MPALVVGNSGEDLTRASENYQFGKTEDLSPVHEWRRSPNVAASATVKLVVSSGFASTQTPQAIAVSNVK